MLFTPSPPLSSQSVSSSVGSESSSIQTASISNARNVENQLHTESNTILVSNGPTNKQLLSTSQSHVSQLPDQDYFYSPFSSSSSSRPSIQLTPTKTIPNITLSKPNRRESCPVSPNIDKNFYQHLHFPTNRTSSIRDVLMATMPTTDHHLSKTNQWSNNTIMPVANPAAAASLIEDNEMTADEEQSAKSITPSPLDTPKNNDRLHRSPTDHNINTNRKIILNVGGVRHESNLFISF